MEHGENKKKENIYTNITQIISIKMYILLFKIFYLHINCIKRKHAFIIAQLFLP